MNLNSIFKLCFFFLLLASEVYFLYVRQYLYSMGVLLLLLIFIIIVEAFERGLSNIMFKTSQTQLDIKMAEKELQKQSRQLATKLTPKLAPKKKIAIEQTTEIIQENLHEAFKKGLKIAGYTPLPEDK